MANTIVNMFAFAVLALLWIGFAVALFTNRLLLDGTWQWFRRLPLLLQALLFLLFLPVVIGLWVWEARWPVWVRLPLVAGLVFVTLYTFFPQV